jgi:hypothetical protein
MIPGLTVFLTRGFFPLLKSNNLVGYPVSKVFFKICELKAYGEAALGVL